MLPADGFTEVRVPGAKSRELRARQLKDGYLEVDDKAYDEFIAAYQELTGK